MLLSETLDMEPTWLCRFDNDQCGIWQVDDHIDIILITENDQETIASIDNVPPGSEWSCSLCKESLLVCYYCENISTICRMSLAKGGWTSVVVVDGPINDYIECDGVIAVSGAIGVYIYEITNNANGYTEEICCYYPYDRPKFVVFEIDGRQKLYWISSISTGMMIASTDFLKETFAFYKNSILAHLIPFGAKALDQFGRSYAIRWETKLFPIMPRCFRKRIWTMLLCLHTILPNELLLEIAAALFYAEVSNHHEFADQKSWGWLAQQKRLR